MRLWPLRGVRQQLRQEKDQAREMIKESRASRRNVEAAEPRVNRMLVRLDFYSERNGFADAFEQMIRDRGNHRAAGG
jgi:hypothetical protein